MMCVFFLNYFLHNTQKKIHSSSENIKCKKMEMIFFCANIKIFFWASGKPLAGFIFLCIEVVCVGFVFFTTTHALKGREKSNSYGIC